MDRRRRRFACGVAGIALATTVIVVAPRVDGATAAPGSMASAISTVPVRPPNCTSAQLAAVAVDNCAVYADGQPHDHGFPVPPFPVEEIVTTPIPPEQWVPLQLGSQGVMVVLLQRALKAYANLADDGDFGPVTESVVKTAQSANSLEPTGIVDAALASILGILVTAETTWPPPGWVYNGNTYSGSPILAEWEARLVQGVVRADPDISPLFEGFLADLARGSLRIDEKSSYGFRCVATSTRNCAGQTFAQLSYHSWGAALDVNWTQNPLQTVSHSHDACSADVQLAMPDWVVKAAMRWGLFWGGWYGCPRTGARSVTRDPHHFEFRGTPDLARRIAARNLAPGAPRTTVPAVDGLLLACGDRGDGVAALRDLLPPGDRPSESSSLAATFTPALATALAGYQHRMGLPATGALDPATATRLGLAVRHTEVFPVVHVNSCGDHTKAVQTALGASATGLFTSGNLATLRAWQKGRGLRPTGVVDTATAAALGLRLPAPSVDPSPSPTTTTTTGPPTTVPSTTAPPTSSPPTTAPGTGPPTTTAPGGAPVAVPLKPGTRHGSVKVLQTALTAAGYPVKLSGYFGTETSRALKAFKADQGLSVTSTLTIEAARRLGLTPVPRVPARYGQRGEHVLLLQQALRDAGYDIEVDGRFGRATRAAVRAYQTVKGLRVTGALDSRTARAFGW